MKSLALPPNLRVTCQLGLRSLNSEMVVGSAPIEALLGRHFTLAQSMGKFAAIVFIVGAIVTTAGAAGHGVSFNAHTGSH